jgi:hypothetical protein
MTPAQKPGMVLFSTSRPYDGTWSVFSGYVDDLIANGITQLRIDIPDYQDAAEMTLSKAGVLRAIAKGAKVTWGVSSNSYNNPANRITAANWPTFRQAILDAAAWAQANGVYEFQLGNEEEFHNDDTTITDAQLIANLKSVATDVQTIFTRGKVSYSCAHNRIPDWASVGKGDIDILASNIYMTIGATAQVINWRGEIDTLVGAFGPDGTYITEFGLNNISLGSYSTDEAVQAAAVTTMLNYITSVGITRADFYDYIDDDFGARKTNGTYRQLWDVLTK